jgi:hypothetical protein
MARKLSIKIADVSISIEGDTDWGIPPAYRPFISADHTADITLCLKRKSHNKFEAEKVFDCPPIWTLYRQNGISLIRIFNELSGLRRTLVLPRHLGKADLYFAEDCNRFVDPFFGPSMELLLLSYLAKGKGIIIHGCGMARKGRGVLFVGESGAGKSTLARMWDGEEGVEILSDDRTIVRRKGRDFWVYGTPWHGDAPFGSPRGVRLESIFFLRHARENSVKEISGSLPVSQLLTCSFPPLWDPQAMDVVLELFTELTARVPCRQLRFTPDRTVLEFINGLVESS